MFQYLLLMLLLSLAINFIGFLIAFKLKTDKLTDFSYALSFVILNGLALIINSDYSGTKIVLFLMILIWALRLGGYLVIRINRWGRDKRFDKMRGDFFKFLNFWMIQGLTVWVVSICSLMFMKVGIDRFDLLNLNGLVIFSLALSLEAGADLQKFHFIANPKNKGKFINSGLWATNRHPNYLGEIFVWLGIYVYCSASFTSPGQPFTALISPLFIFMMIRFISGVPILEKQADKKWGQEKSYQKYKKNSGLLLFKLK